MLNESCTREVDRDGREAAGDSGPDAHVSRLFSGSASRNQNSPTVTTATDATSTSVRSIGMTQIPCPALAQSTRYAPRCEARGASVVLPVVPHGLLTLS